MKNMAGFRNCVALDNFDVEAPLEFLLFRRADLQPVAALIAWRAKQTHHSLTMPALCDGQQLSARQAAAARGLR